jgi:chemotaxis signal transduction protein
LEFVVFTLAGTDYAVPIGKLVEMSRPLPVTPVPNLPEWVLGVANVRGDIVSLVDLRLFLGLERCERPAQQRLLVVRARGEDMTAGLLVDQVRGLRRLPASSFEALAAPVTDRVGAYLQGLAECGGRLLAVLDLDRLLLSPEMRQFGPAHEPAGRR